MKINLKSEKVESTLTEINGNCSAHILDAYTVRKEAAAYFDFLSSKLPKKIRLSARVLEFRRIVKSPARINGNTRLALLQLRFSLAAFSLLTINCANFTRTIKIYPASFCRMARARLAEILLNEKGVF